VRQAVALVVKGAAILVLVGGLLIFGAFVFFVINPPFRTPETGKLSGSTNRDITLAAGHTTTAAVLVTSVNDNALKTSSGKPSAPLMKMSIASIDGGSTDGVRLRLSPLDGGRELGDLTEVSPRESAWTMPCLNEGGDQACRQRVAALIDARASHVDRRLRLSASAYTQYPAFTPTPGWSSLDMGLSTLGREAGQAAVPHAEASGSVDLSMDDPVVVVPLDALTGGATASDGSGAPPAVLRVAVDAEAMTSGGPNGLDAPPPVRLVVLGPEGVIVGRQGLRPGQGARVIGLPLPACSADCAVPYTLAFEWTDRRPEATYRVSWQAEAVSLPVREGEPARVGLTAKPATTVASAGLAIAPADDGLVPHAFEVTIDIGGLPPTETADPVHVQMLVTATVDESSEVGTGATLITPYPTSGGSGMSVPFRVNPGETGSMVVNLDDSCPVARCDRWLLRSGSASRSSSRPLPVTWRLEARVWRLTGDATPIPLALEATTP
jgi:hypothetical protein